MVVMKTGAQIFLNDGASDTQGVPDEDGRLLVGQFTTSGVVFLRYNIRFQGGEEEIFEYTDVELTFPAVEGGCTDAVRPVCMFSVLTCAMGCRPAQSLHKHAERCK